MEKALIGRSFEELQEEEMMNIQGGGPEATVTITSWSSAPCTIGVLTVTVVTAVGGSIYYTVTH